MTPQTDPLNKYSHHIFILYGCALLLCAIYSAMAMRPINYESSFFYYDALSTGFPSVDRGHYRYTDGLWQLPAIFLLKIFGADSMALAIDVMNLTVSLHPFLGLALTWALLPREARSTYFLIPFLSFVTATWSCIAFSGGQILATLTFFWPLLTLTLFPLKNSFFHFLLSLVLILFFSFTHEAAVLLLPAILFQLFLSFFVKKELKLWSFIAHVLLVMGSVLWIFWRLMHVPDKAQIDRFAATILDSVSAFNVFSLIIVGTLTVILAGIYKKRPALPKIGFKFFAVTLSVVGLVLFLIYKDHWSKYNGLLSDARKARTTVAFFTVIFSWIFIAFKQMSCGEKDWAKPLLHVLALCSVVAAISYDINHTKRWLQTTTRIHSILNEGPGCHFASEMTEPRLSDGIGVGYFTTILLQRTNRPSAVLFFELVCPEETAETYNPCHHFDGRYFRNQCTFHYDTETKNFDLSLIKKPWQ